MYKCMSLNLYFLSIEEINGKFRFSDLDLFVI